MTEQFRNFDAPKAPQAVRIEWECLTPRDDTADAPDERDEGFWPSLDPEDCGFIGEDKGAAEFAEAMQAAEQRMQAWRDDEWEFVGVVARAHIAVPIGGGAFCTYMLDSPGLWGVESDSPDYIAEVFEEQKGELLAHLATMGEHFAPNPYKVPLETGVINARRVVANWSSGDLAGAVNGLEEWAGMVETDFPELDLSDDDDAEDETEA